MIEILKKYKPHNEQEACDKAEIIRRLEKSEELFGRDNISAHFTASAWVVNQDRTKVLMAYHNLYDSWAWLGGHADGEKDLLKVDIKEVKEESGLTNVKPISEEVYSLEILAVAGHCKKGKYVPSHLHLNITYLLEADDREPLKIKPDENSQVGWFTPEGAIEASKEEWFKEHIYSKLNEKLSQLR